MHVRWLFGCLVLSLCLSNAAWAQFKKPGDEQGAKLGNTTTQRWRAGMVVIAEGGPCSDLVGTIPVPVDWPEQQVVVVNEDISPLARISYESIEGVKQMIVSIPNLPAGREVKALVTFEVRRSEQIPPDNTDIYELPEKRKLDKTVRPYLAPSPLIESNNPKIKALAKQVGTDKEKAWERVEAIYDWVREKVKYENGPIKGALAALRDETGDCEELTSLFVAICRASDIPARTVWVPGHCYPEFYLVDKEGTGHWFPCQAAGSRAFGGIPETRPVLQKGDNFRDGRERKRYMAEKITGGAAQGKPKVRFVREVVAE